MYEGSIFDQIIYASIAIFAFIGYIGSIRVVYVFLLFHSIFSVLLSVVLIISQFYDILLKYNKLELDSNKISPWKIEFIFSLIQIFSLVIGLLAYKFMRVIKYYCNHDLVNNRNSIKEEMIHLKNSIPLKDFLLYLQNIDKDKCFICKSKNRNITIYPCTHSLVCNECMCIVYKLDIKSLSNPNCPACNIEIRSFAKNHEESLVVSDFNNQL